MEDEMLPLLKCAHTTKHKPVASPVTVKGSTKTPDFLKHLKVDGWISEYTSVNLLLRHLSRKCRSEASRTAYLRRVYSLCVSAHLNPDELVKLPKNKIEKLVQEHADKYNDGEHSVRYANNIIQLLKTFFRVNDFKGAKALEIESYYTPSCMHASVRAKKGRYCSSRTFKCFSEVFGNCNYVENVDNTILDYVWELFYWHVS